MISRFERGRLPDRQSIAGVAARIVDAGSSMQFVKSLLILVDERTRR